MIFYRRKLLSRDNFESILLLLVVFINHRHSIVLVLPQQKRRASLPSKQFTTFSINQYSVEIPEYDKQITI